MEKNNGWISLHRKILQSPIFNKPPEYFKVWIYLLLNVDHQNGIGFFSWNTIKSECRVTNEQLKKCFSFLEKEQMITRKKMPRGVEITILNWDKYQHNERQKTTPTTTPTITPTTTPTTTPTEIGNEINNNAGFQKQKNLKDTNKDTNNDTNKDTSKDTTHNTINKISLISNNIIVSKDTMEGEVLNPSLTEKEKELKDTPPVDMPPSKVAKPKKAKKKVYRHEVYQLVKRFCEEVGHEYIEDFTIYENGNGDFAQRLLAHFTEDEIIEAVRYGKQMYIKEGKDPIIFIPHMRSVEKSISKWRSALKVQKEKQEKQEQQEKQPKKEAGYGYF